MASVKFDIRKLYGEVWGGLVFPELLRRAGGVQDFLFGKGNNTQIAQTNALGKPVQSELTLALEGEELRFVVPPVLTLQGSINVVETAVAGLNGSIKEIASVNDYSVNIKGFLVSNEFTEVVQDGLQYRLNPNDFPEKQLRQLRRFFEAKKAVNVKESRLLSFFNIKKLLFKSINFPELEGYAYIIPFEAETVSDSEYTLIIE